MSKRDSRIRLSAALWRTGLLWLGILASEAVLSCDSGGIDAFPAGVACESHQDCEPGSECRQHRCRGLGRGILEPKDQAQKSSDIEDPASKHSVSGPSRPPSIVWDVSLGAAITAAPVVAPGPSGENCVFVGTHAGRFVGVALGGERQGEVLIDRTLAGMVWSAAVPDDQGRLLVGADDDTVYAIDGRNGAIVWSRRLGDCAAPRVPGPEGSRCDVDGVVPLKGGDWLVAADGVYRLSPEGTIRWHFPPGERSEHVFAEPLPIADLVVIGGQDGRLTAVSVVDGAQRWQIDVGPDVDGAPKYSAAGMIVAGADDGRVLAVTLDGQLIWVAKAEEGIRGAPAIDDSGNVYIGALDGRLYALDEDGQLRWTITTAGAIDASAIFGHSKLLLVGNRAGQLLAIDEDGGTRWSLTLPDAIDAPVTVAPDGTLLVASADGHLRALR